jgi:hypothetical protein
MVLANQNANLTGPDQGFLVFRLVLTLKPWERGCGFPSHMFDRLVHRFLNKIFEPKPPIHRVPKKVVYFLPFTGSHSIQIRTQINRLCGNAAYLNIRFIFRSSKRISSFFPFKDKVPTFLRSGVVCRCCSASYVGQT